MTLSCPTVAAVTSTRRVTQGETEESLGPRGSAVSRARMKAAWTRSDAFHIGQLAQELYLGYMAYAASADVLAHPAIAEVLAVLQAENRGPAGVPIGRIVRGDASEIAYDLLHAIRNIGQAKAYKSAYERLWLAGALLTLGDALKGRDYLDRGPDLEFVRHLRNGVAHGNQFSLRPGQPSRPAHFTGADQRFIGDGTTPVGSGRYFEIRPSLQGKAVLFDFIGPGDVCDLLQFASARLVRIGNGDPPSPLWPQALALGLTSSGQERGSTDPIA